MKNALSKIGLLFLLLLPLLGRAQEVMISGRVVDAKTKKPVPFASISLHETDTGTLSNEEGYFRIAGVLKNQQDSLICMTVAYQRKAVLIERDQTDSLRIEITARPLDSIPCGTRIKEGKPLLKNEIITGLPNTQYAFFIKFVKNEKHQQFGNVRSITLYTGGNGFPMRKFRIHFYEVDSVQLRPGKELLNTQVALLPSKCEGWDTFGLYEFQIIVKRKGCFVGLEFIEPDAPAFHFIDEPYMPYGTIMRAPSAVSEQSVWTYTTSEGWKEIPATGSISYQYAKMIRVSVDLMRN